MHFINSTEGDFVFNLFGIHTLHSTVPPEHLAAEFALKILINSLNLSIYDFHFIYEKVNKYPVR